MHYLVVCGWVSDHKQTRFTKCLLDLIGERSRSEPAGDGVGSSVKGKLQDGTLDTEQEMRMVLEREF